MKTAITKILAGMALAGTAAICGAAPAVAVSFNNAVDNGTSKIQTVDDQLNHWERQCRSLGPKFGVACTQWQMKPGPCAARLPIWVCRPA